MSCITSFERISREEGLQQGLQQGREQGIQESRKAEDLIIAQRMLTLGYNFKEIREITQLSEQELAEAKM